MGDPAGIGPEIILKAYRRSLPRHIAVVFGDLGILRKAALVVPSPPEIRVVDDLAGPFLTSREGLNLMRVTELPPESVQPGRVHALTGKAAGRYIDAAIQAALKREVDAVVTCPIHKRAFHLGGYQYPGHTEMFAERTKSHLYAMMMVSSPLKVALTTIHLPLREIFHHLTSTRIREIIGLTHRTLQTWFGIPSPRIAVLALNPHGGEEGDLGQEEKNLITPVIQELKARGLDLSGPLPPDTAFCPTIGNNLTPSWPCTTTKVSFPSNSSPSKPGSTSPSVSLSPGSLWTMARVWISREKESPVLQACGPPSAGPSGFPDSGSARPKPQFETGFRVKRQIAAPPG
jgi:4-hydroxythreonine-4-phosphate dehydrogenase